MSKLTKSIFILALLTGCSTNRYLINDNGVVDKFLINVLKTLSETKQISRKPLIVVDLKPYRYDKELKTERLSIPVESIAEIDLMAKDPGIDMYGKSAKGGVILITTKPFQKRETLRPNSLYKILKSVSTPIDFTRIYDKPK
jgi:hypothetical protein